MTATTLAPAPTPRSAAELAAATPAKRDRYVDFLRVASLAVVMLGHWLMAALVWDDGRLRATNILETAQAAQWLTWLFQIMPVFFIVGGFANSVSWASTVRKGGSYGEWLGSRLTRLIRPVLAFALVWTALVVGLRVAGVNPAALRASSIAQPLWFLAVYVAVVALAPIMVAAQRRWGWGVPVVLAAGVALVDLARWPLGVPLVGWANLALVWLFAHQVGVAWQSGAVAAWSRRRLAGLAVAGLATVVVLTELAGYPHSMVGGVGESRSNTFPPSLALVALATWQFGLVLSVRSVADRWLSRPRPWAAVVAANGMAMTVYLWHLTPMVAVAAVMLPTGLMPQRAAGSAAWWAWRPLWIALLTIALIPLVAVFARIELARVTWPRPSGGRAAVAAVLMAAGFAVLARKGFVTSGMPWNLPFAGLGLVGAAWWTLRAHSPR
jgi:hypothetical protein